MRKKITKIRLTVILIIVLIFLGFVFFWQETPDKITYGASFSKYHADELKINWKEAFLAILDDLKVKYLRLSAHWPNIQPEEALFNFKDLDFQVNEAEKRGSSIILAIGRRLPGWPECHEPKWVSGLNDEEKRVKVLEYITAVVQRYKDRPSIKYWQVENEVFLTSFAENHCGSFSNEEFLKKEISLVKEIDPDTKILLTDSGELGLWYKAYRNSDVFATSLYLYIWNHKLGPLRYPITPAFFLLKKNLVKSFYGQKNIILSELSAEPWLLKPIIDTEIDVQLKRMNIDKFNKSIEFAKRAGFDEQLLWGAEWWYWMKENGHPEFWERAKKIFK